MKYYVVEMTLRPNSSKQELEICNQVGYAMAADDNDVLLDTYTTLVTLLNCTESILKYLIINYN